MSRPSKGFHREVELSLAAEALGRMLAAKTGDFTRAGPYLEQLENWVGRMDAASVLKLEVGDILDEPGRREDGILFAACWLLWSSSRSTAPADPGTVTPGASKGGSNASSRAVAAEECLRKHLYWREQRHPTPRTAFDMNGEMLSPRTRDVAIELAWAIDARLKRLREDAAFRDERQRRWRLELLPQAEGRIVEAFRDMADAWNTPTGLYPPHLTPERLAGMLSLSAVPSQPSLSEVTLEGELYDAQRSYGGRPVLDVLGERRLVVLGNPGGGKSTVLAAGVLDSADRGVPAIFVRLSSITRTLKRPVSLTQLVKLLVRTAVTDAGARVEVAVSDLAKALLSDRRALIALDGLDEVRGADLDAVLSTVRQLRGFEGKVVISSRWTGYSTPPGEWEERCVDHLSTPQAEEFFDLWFKGGNAEAHQRAKATLESRHQADMIGIPVLLGIVALVAQQGEVPGTEAQLYEKYVTRHLSNYWKQHAARETAAELAERRQAAQWLAWAMATGFSGKHDQRRWTDVTSLSEVSAAVERMTATSPASLPPPAVGVIEDLAHRHALISADWETDIDQSFRWIHRTVHEHLVGAYLAQRLFDPDAEYFGIPLEILLGPSQWLQPLRHFLGLLPSEDGEAFILRLDELVDAGDPGWVIKSLVMELALVFPQGASIRRKLGSKEVKRKRTHDLWRLDIDQYKMLILDLARRGDVEALNIAPTFTTLEEDDLAEDFIRELIQVQRRAPDRSVEWVRLSARLWSRHDPDDALCFLLENRIHENRVLPYGGWGIKALLPGTASMAIAEIASWHPPERLNYLQFLASIDVDLVPHAAPSGPLDPLEVLVATELRQPRRETDTRPLMPDEWSPAVAAAVLGGAFGPNRAFVLTFSHHDRLPQETEFGDAAELAVEISGLLGRVATADKEVDVEHALSLLAGMTAEKLAGDVTARKAVAAVGDLLCANQPIPLDGLFRAHWALGVCRFAPFEDPRFSSTRFAHIRVALYQTLMKVLMKTPDDLVPAILQTDPADWIASPPLYADIGVLEALQDVRTLTTDELVSLMVWAGRQDIQLLHLLKLGSDAPEIARRVWEIEPKVFVSSSYHLAIQLAEAGALREWRERLAQAEIVWRRLLADWEGGL